MPIRRPAPKPATAAPAAAATPKVKAAPKAAAAATPAATPQAKYSPGDIVLFTKYKEGTEAGIFEPGQEIYLHSSQQVDHPSIKNKKLTVFIAVPAESAEAAKALTLEQLAADDSGIAAEEVSASVIKIKPAPKEIEPPYHPKAIGAMVQYAKAANLTDQVKTLLEAEKQSQFYIGGTLAFLRFERGEEITALGYEDIEVDGRKVTAWQQYLDAEFNLSVRTGDAYIMIYRRFSELPGFDPKVISAKDGIGWSKAAVIANYLVPEDKDKSDEIIKTAKETPIADLRTVMVEKYTDAQGRAPGGANRQTGGAGRTAAAIKTWTFRLPEAKGVGVAKVFELASKQLGLPVDSPDLFEQIVLQWGQQNLTAANVKAAGAVLKKPTAVAAPAVSRTAPRRAPAGEAAATA